MFSRTIFKLLLKYRSLFFQTSNANARELCYDIDEDRDGRDYRYYYFSFFSLNFVNRKNEK